MHAWWSEVRSRAAAAIEAAPGTVEHAARGPGVLEKRLLLTGRFFRGVQGPSRPRKNLPGSQGPETSTCEPDSGTAARVDLTAPVKIYIIIIVQIHRNEHEFPLMIRCGRRRRTL